MQIILERVDQDTVQIRSTRLDMVSLMHVVIAGTLKLGVDIDISELQIGKPVMIDG